MLGMLKVGVFDYASKYVIPAIKKMLITVLYREYGLTQLTISRLAGISQSAVSKNVSKRKTLTMELEALPQVEETVRRLADGLINGSLKEEELESAVSMLAAALLREGYLCKHHLLVSGGSKLNSCNLCRELFKVNYVIEGGDKRV